MGLSNPALLREDTFVLEDITLFPPIILLPKAPEIKDSVKHFILIIVISINISLFIIHFRLKIDIFL